MTLILRLPILLSPLPLLFLPLSVLCRAALRPELGGGVGHGWVGRVSWREIWLGMATL